MTFHDDYNDNYSIFNREVEHRSDADFWSELNDDDDDVVRAEREISRNNSYGY